VTMPLGSEVQLPTGERVSTLSRLQCVQSAVHVQVEQMRRAQPDSKIIIVPFSSSITVLSDHRTSTLAGRILNAGMSELVEKGENLASEMLTIHGSTSDLIGKIWKLRATGSTALGPALAVSVGLCPSGGRVVVCTDGLANQGIGAVSKGAACVPFYTEMSACAAARGVTISVLTMEGEECAMEHLGTAADITGGQVEIVDPSSLGTKFAALAAERSLATNAVVSVRIAYGWLADGSMVSERSLGSICSDSDVCFRLSAPDSSSGTDNSMPASVRIQVQLRYTGRDRGEYLAALATELPLSTERAETEGAMDPEVVGVAAMQRAARLAQEGQYRAARLDLLGTQRLLQRAMRSERVQHAYFPFIVQAERLDQFIREREAQEMFELRDAGRRRADRDDEAARAIYQMKSLSLSQFRR